MAQDEDTPTLLRPDPDAPAHTAFHAWELVPAIGVGIAAARIAWEALSSAPTYDIGLAYQGGAFAWATGHPEHVPTWISTPSLGAGMAVVSRIVSEGAAAWLLTVLNIVLVGAAYTVIWKHLRSRPRLGRAFWWITLAGAVVYAPMVSSLWWKQLNLVALALAAVSFLLVRSRRPGPAALVLAVSILVKPMAILVPVALLFRRETRRVALLTIAWGVGITAASQLFLAQRAGSLGAVNPLPAWDNFSQKSQPANVWACHPENFSPLSTMCRLAGSESFGVSRVFVLAGVALFGGFVLLVLRTTPFDSWRIFAFACALSPMVSPIAWSHYQVMLIPLFLVLAVELHERAAPWIVCAGVVAAYGLAELIWRPAISLPGALDSWITGTSETTAASFRVMSYASCAPYVLAVTALLWFAIAGTPLAQRERITIRARRPRSSQRDDDRSPR